MIRKKSARGGGRIVKLNVNSTPPGVEQRENCTFKTVLQYICGRYHTGAYLGFC